MLWCTAEPTRKVPAATAKPALAGALSPPPQPQHRNVHSWPQSRCQAMLGGGAASRTFQVRPGERGGLSTGLLPGCLSTSPTPPPPQDTELLPGRVSLPSEKEGRLFYKEMNQLIGAQSSSLLIKRETRVACVAVGIHTHTVPSAHILAARGRRLPQPALPSHQSSWDPGPAWPSSSGPVCVFHNLKQKTQRNTEDPAWREWRPCRAGRQL